MTLTKAVLAERLSDLLGVTKREANDIVARFFEEIEVALETGDDVKLSAFGLFKLREKPPRRGRNPTTGEEVPVCARRVVTFHASPKLRTAIDTAIEERRRQT